MAYEISGTVGYPCRIIVVNESDWTIDANEEVGSVGPFSTSFTASGTKTVLAFESSSGEVVGFGSVTPIEVPE